MAKVSEIRVALRFYDEELDPRELSECLGAEAHSSSRKGELALGRRAKGDRPASIGTWMFEVNRRERADLEEQIRELFSSLSPDLKVWRDLSERYEPDLFVGLFLDSANEGFDLSAGCMKLLADRSVALAVTIYCAVEGWE